MLIISLLLYNLSFGLVAHVRADTYNNSDIIIAKDDVMVIDNETYNQTGNIYIRDNAKLEIRNSILIFNQRFHEEFAIWVDDNASLAIVQSSIITGTLPEENYEIHIRGNSQITISDSDLFTTKGYLWFNPQHNGSATVNNSKIHYLSIAFSPNGSSTIFIDNSEINFWEFRFNNYQGDFSNLGPGTYNYWTYKENSYDITVKNTKVIFDMGIHVDLPSQITIRNSHFHQLGSNGIPDVGLTVIDSSIMQFTLHGFGPPCSVVLSDLKKGFYEQWNLRDFATGNCIPDVKLENTEIIEGWLVTTFGADLSIDNSDLARLASLSGAQSDTDITKVSNSKVNEFMLYFAHTKFIFDNTTVQNSLNVYLPSNATVDGNVRFAKGCVISNWLDSTIKRRYPILLMDEIGNAIPNAKTSLYTKDNDLLWNGITDNEGRVKGEIEFNDENYSDFWKLVIQYGGNALKGKIALLSSTPIVLSELNQFEIGDLNNDDNVDLTDALLNLQLLSGFKSLNIYQAADVNEDNKIGLEEVIYILQKISGLR